MVTSLLILCARAIISKYTVRRYYDNVLLVDIHELNIPPELKAIIYAELSV